MSQSQKGKYSLIGIHEIGVQRGAMFLSYLLFLPATKSPCCLFNLRKGCDVNFKIWLCLLYHVCCLLLHSVLNGALVRREFFTVGLQKHARKHWSHICEKYTSSHKMLFYVVCRVADDVKALVHLVGSAMVGV